MRGLKEKLILMISGALVTATMVLMPVAPVAAARYTDGLSFVNCQGRFSMGTVNIGNAGSVTAYGCSNGYFYAVTKANSKSNIVASITRVSPYNYQVKADYAYQAITNMTARLNGSCYEVWGSIQGSGGKGWRFCW